MIITMYILAAGWVVRWLLVTRVEIERRDSVGRGRTGGTSGKLRNSDVLVPVTGEL